MMLKRHLRNSCLSLSGSLVICLVLSATAFSQDETRTIRGPVTITSEMLTADNQARTALFEGSVVARTSDVTIYSDKMLVSYDKNTGNVMRIDATGRVRFVKEDRVVTSHEATYQADGEKLVFTGEPRAVEGENVVSGRRMTYLLNEDRLLVEDSKVFLNKKDQ